MFLNKKFLNKPISVKFFLISLFLIVFLLFVLIFSSIVLYKNYQSLYEQNVQKGSRYAEGLATFSLEYFLNQDFATLENVYLRLFSDQNIQEVALIEKGNCLLKLTRSKGDIKTDYAIPCPRDFFKGQPHFVEAKEELIFYAPISSENEALAWIKIVISKREFTSLVEELAKMALIILLLSVLLSLMLLLFFLRFPLRSLSLLENFAQSLPEKFGKTVTIRSPFKELRTLEETLNYASLKLKEITHSLELEKEKLLVTLLSIGDAVIVADEKGRVILMNNMAEELTGYQLNEVYGKEVKTFLRLVSEQTGEPVEDPVSAVLVDGKRRELANHTLLIRRDGEILSVEDSASPIFTTDGELLGVVFVFRDVTEKVKTQRELMRLEKMNLVNRLAGGVAHDLNNLLASMQNYLYLANIHKRDLQRLTEVLSKMENIFQKAGSLTRQLLDLSKGMPRNMEVVDLKELVTDIANYIFLGTPVEVHMDIPENTMNLKGDLGQLTEVFQNILINARDVLGSGGRVEIKAENAGDFVKIRITDNGPGIPKEILPRIFEPFFTTKKEGTGLGLSIVQSIVENHGGRVEVSTEEGKMTTFILYLPGTREEVKKEEKRTLEMRDLPKGLKVLVVEDDPEIRESLKEILEFFGFSVDTAENGERGLEKFRASLETGKVYDLIITDFTMPGRLSGPELAVAIKELKGDAKIIGASGYIQSSEDYTKYLAYFEALLPKPFNLSTLKDTLLKVLAIH
jgi:PAS domain S-box-containing protein